MPSLQHFKTNTGLAALQKKLAKPVGLSLAPKPVASKTGPFANIQGGVTPANTLAPPPAAPLPLDPTYDSQITNAQKNFNDTNSAVTYDWQTQGKAYGYQADPTTGAVTEDASDPFSRRAMLVRAYAQQQGASRNALGARGQLYSGAAQNAYESNRYANTQATDTLQKDFQGLLQSLRQRRIGATNTLNQTTTDAEAARLSRVVAAPPTNVAPVAAPVEAYQARTNPAKSIKVVPKKKGKK